MALGSAYYRAMSAGLVAGIALIPPSTYFEGGTQSQHTEIPWEVETIGSGYQSPQSQTAARYAGSVLRYVQAANEYRENGGPAGAVTWSSVSSVSGVASTTEVNCEISSSDQTVCVVTPPDYINPVAVAAQANFQHGLPISGIFDGTDIVAPDGSTMSVPSVAGLNAGDLVIVREGK